MTSCTSCGREVAEGSNFCPHCGTQLKETFQDTTGLMAVQTGGEARPEGLSDDDAAAIEALPAGSALLVAERGPDLGARYLLSTDTIVAGRHTDCDIFLDDITVSRHHAEFARGEGQMTVRDLGSLNGVMVNRTPIDGTVVLRNGDEVQIGKYRLSYYESPLGLE